MENPREQALDVLMKVDKKESYLILLLEMCWRNISCLPNGTGLFFPA